MGATLKLMTEVEEKAGPEDRDLVEAARKGDMAAFEELVRRKTSRVYGHCYRLIGNGEDAKDIAQLVFIKLWENLDKYDAGYSFDTWLYRIVTNVTIDFVRSRQTRDAAVNSNLRLVRSAADPEQPVSCQRKEIEEIFEDVSSTLSPKQKAIFVMREMDDLPSAEISRILGCRESTVRNHLFNARKVMQKRLRERFPEYARLWRDDDAM
ncbi:MAG TPA: RNA polymerase sigma factor [Thermoanaerobaculia bacterium]|nr:RNA polymerase sigma factor [Thermoanaerobaculia bacterium]